jgi:hypothetical protein
VLLPWTTLQPSVRERRWSQVARAGVVLGAGASSVALLGAQPPALLAAGVVVLAAVGSLVFPRRRTVWQLGIADDGRVVARSADTAPERSLQCLFASTWLVTLRTGTEVVAVWPDSVPPDTYRRIWVHLRWAHAGPPAAASGANDGR